jgi:hypothetical protein
MRKQSRRRLFCEQLEARDCPSLTVQSLSGSLFIRGTPQGALNVLESTTVANRFTVTDKFGSATPVNLGSYNVTGNIDFFLNNHPSTVTVNLGNATNRLLGSVLFSLGNGDTSGLSPLITVQNGTVAGSVQFIGGNGKETLSVGGPALAPVPITINGSVTVNAKQSGGGFTGPGDTFFVGPGTTVKGDVNSTQADSVDIGEPGLALTTVLGNVNINDAGAGASLTAHIFGNVGKSATVTGTNNGDFFLFTPASAGVGGNITGNLSVSLGAGAGIGGGNNFDLTSGTTVGGSVNLNSSTATSDVFTVASAIGGNLTANLGNGGTTALPTTFALFDGGGAGSVGGYMSLSAGNGNNSIDLSQGTVSGNLNVNLGSGNDTATFGTAPGGVLNWTSGNGADSVTLGSATSPTGQVWNVHMQFGTGSDTLTLAGPATQFLTGFIDMGGPPGGNSFDPTGQLAAGTWVVIQPFTLQNV